MQEACNKMEQIFTTLSEVSNEPGDGVNSQSNAMPNMDFRFFSLNAESFSTDHSEVSRLESLGVTRKRMASDCDAVKVLFDEILLYFL